MQLITTRFFSQLVLPLMAYLPELTVKYQGDFACRKLFTQAHLLLTIFGHFSRAEGANDLANQLGNLKLATAEMVGHTHGAIAPSTLSRANQTRPYEIWQELFAKLYQKASPHFKKLHLGGLADLNHVRLVDGSLFSATSAMLWASYSTRKNKLKGHFFMDLNGLPDQLIVSKGKASERAVLLGALVPKVTYVFDRGYNSYELFIKIRRKEAYFVTRLLCNATYRVFQHLEIPPEEARVGVIADQIIVLPAEKGAEHKLRLVTFQDHKGEIYQYLTNRLDLKALTIVQLYLWRWEIELLFAWLKRHLVFQHWYSENENGVRIQLFAGLLCYLLLRLYAATRGEIKVRIGLLREIKQQLSCVVTEAELNAYQLALFEPNTLIFCYTFSELVQRN